MKNFVERMKRSITLGLLTFAIEQIITQCLAYFPQVAIYLALHDPHCFVVMIATKALVMLIVYLYGKYKARKHKC